MLELRHLHNFVVVCRHTNLARAASNLGVGVSTLSASLKSLEREIGTVLFRRSTSGLCPLPSARWLYRIASDVLLTESFGRRFMQASKRSKCGILTLEIRLDFAFGKLNNGVNRAIEAIASSDPLIMVDVRWSGEPAPDSTLQMIKDFGMTRRGRVVIDLLDETSMRADRETVLLADRWALGCRLPVGTNPQPQARQVFSGPVIVPALQTRLLDQIMTYLRDFEISGVGFSGDHPGSLPTFFKDNPDAAGLAPESLLSPQLGLSHLATIPLSPPLAATIVARIEEADPVADRLFKRLRDALASPQSGNRQPPVISSRKIHYFNILHRTRRVSIAAQAASIVQPAMTDQLHQLEDKLGAQLFERRSDGLIPTADGERFASIASILESGLQTIAAGSISTQRATGVCLSLGMLPSVSQYGYLVNRVAEAVLAVQARHHAIKLVVIEGPTETLQSWVMRGFVGLAIVETGLPNMPRLPLGASEPLAAIVHPRHSLLSKGPVTLAQLASLPLALPRSLSGLRQLLDAAARKQGLFIVPRVEIDGLAMLIAVLNREQMFTVLPASAVQREIDCGELKAYPIVEPEISRNLFVIYSADRSLTEPERDLVRTLRKGLARPKPEA